MKQIFKIAAFLFKNRSRTLFNGKKSKFVPVIILVAFLYVFLLASFIGTVIFIGPSFAQSGQVAEFLSIIAALDFLLITILGIISTIQFLFLGKDIEAFLPLPIKTSTMFAARLLVVYLEELIVSAALTLPTMIVAGVVCGVPWFSYICIVVAVAAVPMLAMSLVSLLAALITPLITLFKNKALGTTVIYVLCYALYFPLYIGVVFGNGEEIINMLPQFAKTIYPLYAWFCFATAKPVFGLGVAASMLVEAAIFIGTLAVMSVLIWLVGKTTYKFVINRINETAQSKSKKVGSNVQRGVDKTLMKKEFRETIRNPIFINSYFGLVICPILMVIAGFNFKNMGAFGDITDAENVYLRLLLEMTGIFTLLGVVPTVCAQMASTCISREGSKIILAKMMPVDYWRQVVVKRRFCTILSSISSGLSFIVLLIMQSVFTKSFPWILLAMPVLLFLVNRAMINFEIYFDLKKPVLHWTSSRELNKFRIGVLIAMLNMLIQIVLFLVVIIVGAVKTEIFRYLTIGYVAVLYCVAIPLVIFSGDLLKRKTPEFFERIQY